MGVKDYTGTLPAVRQCEMKKCDPCLTKKNAIPKKVPYQKSAIPKKSTIPKKVSYQKNVPYQRALLEF